MKFKKIATASLASAALIAGALFVGVAPANAVPSTCYSGESIGGTPGYVKITCQGSVRVQWRCSLAPAILSSRALPYSSIYVTRQFLACDVGYPINIGWSNL